MKKPKAKIKRNIYVMWNIINYFLGCNRKLDSGEKDKLTEKQPLKVIQSKKGESEKCLMHTLQELLDGTKRSSTHINENKEG